MATQTQHLEEFERAVWRDRWIVGACLAVLCVLAWIWLVREADSMSMSSLHPADMAAMSRTAMDRMVAPRAPVSRHLSTNWFSVFVMWWVMMVAMMLPSVIPMILAFTRASRVNGEEKAVLAHTLVFTGVYGVLWTSFSAVLTTAQLLLISAGLISELTLTLGNHQIAGGLLVLVGTYQLTPFKRACLDQCRSPSAFVTRMWRPGWRGAVNIGLRHGIYCLGCCWLLTELLFVGGVMNLAWIAGIAVIVTFEKVAPIGQRGAMVVGFVAIAAGTVMLVRP